MTNAEIVLARLRKGPCTNREFAQALGVGLYSAAISELRARGWRIHRTARGNGVFVYELEGKR